MEKAEIMRNLPYRLIGWMFPHDLTYKSSDIFSIHRLEVDNDVVTTAATGQLLSIMFKYNFEQMQADSFSFRLEDEHSVCFEIYKFIREQYIQTLFN